jgi:hypothetical protein
VEEVVDDFFRCDENHNALNPLLEISHTQRLNTLVEVVVQRYFSSDMFRTQLETVLIQSGVFQPLPSDSAALIQKSQPSEVNTPTNDLFGAQKEMTNSVIKKRKTDFDMKLKAEGPSIDFIAWRIFATIQFQYDQYMKEVHDESERHHIQCQAYSVVKAKCCRSTEIKNRIQQFVLEYIESAGYPNSGLDKQAIDHIKSAIYDASSKYKISLTL